MIQNQDKIKLILILKKYQFHLKREKYINMIAIYQMIDMKIVSMKNLEMDVKLIQILET